jgi:glycine/serine hydroxymethyltransferase
LASGIRIGTAAITTRGILPDIAGRLAVLIDMALKGDSVLQEVQEITAAHPIP